jgi:hypothetical protein
LAIELNNKVDGNIVWEFVDQDGVVDEAFDDPLSILSIDGQRYVVVDDDSGNFMNMTPDKSGLPQLKLDDKNESFKPIKAVRYGKLLVFLGLEGQLKVFDQGKTYDIPLC